MPDEVLTSIATHLEYFGYSVTLQDDGWLFVEHPTRADFSLKPFAFGVRAVALFALADVPDRSRAVWLEYVNRCNDRALFVNLAFTTTSDGHDAVRVSALFPSAYDRQGFAVLMDLWHRELDFARDTRPEEQPESTDSEEDEEEEETPAEPPVTH